MIDTLRNLTIPTNPEDIQMMLYSGKGPFDTGSLSLCQLAPSLHYVTLNAMVEGQNFYMGLCVYSECSPEHLSENIGAILNITSEMITPIGQTSMQL